MSRKKTELIILIHRTGHSDSIIARISRLGAWWRFLQQYRGYAGPDLLSLRLSVRERSHRQKPFSTVSFMSGNTLIDQMFSGLAPTSDIRRRGCQFGSGPKGCIIAAHQFPVVRYSISSSAPPLGNGHVVAENGRGTIRFGQAASAWASGFQSMSPAFDPTPQFLAIDDARRVFDLIQRTPRKANQ